MSKFPTADYDPRTYTYTTFEPTSLRDQFAMAALTGLLANSAPGESYATLEAPVEWSYKYADAMMKAREVKSEGLEL